MKPNYLVVTILATGVVLTGCYTPEGRPDNTATGALAGEPLALERARSSARRRAITPARAR